MRSLLDATCSPAGAVALRERSHDCVAAQEYEELRTAGDAGLWAWAQAHERALVTGNAKDLVPLAAASGDGHFGLILTHNRSLPRHTSRSVGELVPVLHRLHLARPGDDATGWVHWLQP